MFRTEAIQSRKVSWIGEIVLTRPPSFAFLTAIAALFASVIVAFLMVGSYTKRATVPGQLVSDLGQIKIYSPQQGIVLKKFAKEGQIVKAGDALFLISSDRQQAGSGNIQQAVSELVRNRKSSLDEELRQTDLIHRADRSAATKRVNGLSTQVQNLEAQIAGQRLRNELVEQSIARSTLLAGQGFYSKEQLQQKTEELIDHQNRLRALQRDLASAKTDMDDQLANLQSLPIKQANQRANLSREIAIIDQQLVESEGKREIIVRAPQNGIATAVMWEVGQFVEPSKPLMSMIQKDANLEVHLYAPSKSIGFVRAGSGVLLRYQSFPYQKFGQARGAVVSISRVAISASELVNLGGVSTAAVEPLYRIVVQIPKQFVMAYGEKQPLQAGMAVEGDVMLETRKLYEWVLEPVFSLSGKI